MYLKTVLPYNALWGPFPDIFALERFVAQQIIDVPQFALYFSGGYELLQVHLLPEIWELRSL